MNIVVVDDHDLVLNMYAQMIKLFGFSPSAFVGAAEAVVHMQNFGPSVDLIITDYKMPGMNGLQFICELRKQGFQTPCIMLTGNISDVDMSKATEYNIKVFGKPVKMDALLSYIQTNSGCSLIRG